MIFLFMLYNYFIGLFQIKKTVDNTELLRAYWETYITINDIGRPHESHAMESVQKISGQKRKDKDFFFKD